MKRSKKILKEKILQQTGITGNTKEEKVRIAEEILNDSEHKQDLCNSYQGLDFSFIEKVMEEVLRNNKIKNSGNDKPPEEFSERISSIIESHKRAKKEKEPEEEIYRTADSFYTKEEARVLVKASKK